MDEVTIPQVDNHLVDEEFTVLLDEDFNIGSFSLNRAFTGSPSATKKQAIEICEFYTEQADGDPVEAGRMIRAWAQSLKVGQYHPAIQGGPALTFGGKTGFEIEGV
jgi:hypothetical protein